VIYDPAYIEQMKSTLMEELENSKNRLVRFESRPKKGNPCNIIEDLETIISQFESLCIDYGESVDMYDGYAFAV